ncbi:MAG: hypothetical protein U0800_01255 [Isosphaeraceae bacterium]
MLETIRTQDRPAWRSIVRAERAGNPVAWTRILSALRRHFPDAPGVPPRRAGDLGASTGSPSLALPLGPNFDLGTRWDQVNPNNATNYQTSGSVAMSPDSTIWAAFPGNPQTLYQYDPQGQAWYNVWTAPGTITGVSAGFSSPTLGRSVAVTYVLNGVTNLALLSGPAQYGVSLKAETCVIPGNSASAQVAMSQVAGTNRAIWALVNGAVWRLSGTVEKAVWVPIGMGGLKLRQITVASSGSLWGIATFPGTNRPDRAYRRESGRWLAAPSLTGLTTLSGTGDGTLWAQGAGGQLNTLSSDGSQWLPVTSISAAVNQNPTRTNVVTPANYTAFAAGSKYRAAAADPNGGVQLLTYGLADQPKSGFPAMDAGEQAGYAYINQYLGITAPGGIRSMYQEASDANTLTGYQSTLLRLWKGGVPKGLSISLEDWTSISGQVYHEVYSVVAVYDYFGLIQSLTNELGSQVPLSLSNTSQMVQLSKDQKGSIFGVILDQVFSAALAGIVKAFSGPAGVAASLIASGISDSIADATRGSSGRNYDLNYYELSTLLYDIFTGADATDAALEAAILSDPNRFLPFGVGVRSNTLGWPVATSEQIAGKTLTAFQSYFLEKLAPIVWPIYYATGYPADSVQGCWPSYTSYFQPGSGSYGTIYVMGTPGTFGFNFPDQSLNLLSTIVSLTGATQAQVLTNQLGWFRMVERSAFFMLAYCQGPPPAGPM